MSSPAQSTEQHLSGLEGFDGWDDARILSALMAGQRRALDAVNAAIPEIAQAADAIVPRLAAGGKLVYAGAGSSARIAVQDGSELPATFGMSEKQLSYLVAGGRAAMFETLAEAEDDATTGKDDGATCTSRDALIAVAASGRTPYTLAVATAARASGCLVISIVNNKATPLGHAADIEILLDSGPEVISGSTRMGAGTAQKAALNLLSTLVQTRLGAVHDGYMVNVIAGNAKLLERSAGIVSEIAGVESTDALAALHQSNGNIKLAVLILQGAGTLEAAKEILSGSGSQLRLALAKLKKRV